MKKIILFASAVLVLFANTAIADSIAHKVAVTIRGGATQVFNSEVTDVVMEDTDNFVTRDIKMDLGYTIGGEVMYGITDHMGVDFDVIYFQADGKLGTGQTIATMPEYMSVGRIRTIDLALGVQWRFLPKSQFVPYASAGVDVMFNGMDFVDGSDVSADPTFGGHLSLGGDFFLNPHVALNAEIRGLYSSYGYVKYQAGRDLPIGSIIAKYDPSNISAFLGIKVVFP